ncbi:unnamed protein product [Schistocephalus solidus]|uniref:Uncharacterized protein n=1 Tax=Schistocephalus solidus TaxID=70667 RepID=A0A183SV76_SCHSO|nr:unnamed protein product [Schistocephalus solidus]
MTCLIHHQDGPYAEEFPFHLNRHKPRYQAGENVGHSELQASPSHQDDTQLVEHYPEAPPEGGYALPEVFTDEQQVEKLVRVPPEGGSATEQNNAAGVTRFFL